MADMTIAAPVQLLDWSILDDTGGEPFLSGGIITSDSWLGTNLMIDMAHADANDAGSNEATCKIWNKGGTTNEDWHLWMQLSANAGQANAQILAAASGSGQANPDRIEVAATANFQTPGDMYFLKDVGTLANSCLITNRDYVSNDYVRAIHDLVNAYDNADYLYDIVDQWIVLVPPTKYILVTFHNKDGDATYACRIQYEAITDIE